jgi:phthiocerol/phenolphthiocerol synthesis type-I polyketide synthase E
MSDELDPEAVVAIVGMAGRFPGAGTVEELWRNSIAGEKGLRRFTDEEMLDAGVSPARLADPAFVRVGGPLEDVDLFDAGLFGLTRREAEFTDPQHRLFAETCVEALENAGYPAMNIKQRVGVFAGCGFPDYLWSTAGYMADPGAALMIAVGTERDSLAPFVSYKLGLTGPSMSVQTFCSTSLVAVHLAAQALLNYECEMALAGGVYIPLPQGRGYQYEEGGIYSPDGTVRTFDASANGSVMGNGVNAVVLKRLSDALDEGCHVTAVILGSAVNNDGRSRVGFTAPGVDGEAQVMADALAFANVDPASIDYIECHGTGTMLGDSVEVAAMDKAYPLRPGKPIAIGSLKQEIGHLDRAAGATSIIRAAIALREETLPAVHDFRTPNPALASARDKFRVLTQPEPWPVAETPRRAGVSAFGLGGVNAHVVLQEPPARPAPELRPGPHLLVVSARNEDGIDEATSRLRDHLLTYRDLNLADVAYTLQASRSQFPWRRAFVCADDADALDKLAAPERTTTVHTTSRNPLVQLLPAAGIDETWWRDLGVVVGDLSKDVVPDDADEPENPGLRCLAAALEALGVRTSLEDPGRTATGTPVTLEVSSERAPAEWWADALARVWQAGAEIRWRRLHGPKARRVPLPTYPFQRRRYWLDPPAAGMFSASAEATSSRTDDLDAWTYTPTWQGAPAPLVLDDALRASGPWLVLAADDRMERLAEWLQARGVEVVVARIGAGIDDVSPGRFEVRPGSVEDLDRLLGRLDSIPATVVHGFLLNDDDDEARTGEPPETSRDLGLGALRALVAAYSNRAPDLKVNLLVVTDGAYSVWGEMPVSAEAAAVQGMLPTVAQENPGWVCRSVDIAKDSDAGIAPLIAREAVTDFAGPVAVRRTSRWVRRYHPLPLPPAAAAKDVIAPGSVVLMTGALGYVGRVLARHLGLGHGCRLVLTSRTPLPPREEWDAVAEGSTTTSHRVRALRELAADGVVFEVVTADVADADAVKRAVQEAVDSFGSLDLVVHAAGISDPRGFGMAHLVCEEGVGMHFDAKTGGFANLDRALADRDVPGIVFSSLSATLGGIALGPYAASNAALDAEVLTSRAAGRRWASVQWDTWGKGEGDDAGEFDMRLEQATELFDRAVAGIADVPLSVVSTGDLGARVQQWVVEAGGVDLAMEDDGVRDPRPDLSTPMVEPAPGLETELADIWARVLRLTEVGIDDNFFLLGGTSVLAIGLVARIRSQFKVAVQTSAVMGYPTVRGLAAQIEAMSAPSADTRDEVEVSVGV